MQQASMQGTKQANPPYLGLLERSLPLLLLLLMLVTPRYIAPTGHDSKALAPAAATDHAPWRRHILLVRGRCCRRGRRHAAVEPCKGRWLFNQPPTRPACRFGGEECSVKVATCILSAGERGTIGRRQRASAITMRKRS